MYRIWKDYKFIFTDFALQGNRYKTHHEKVSDIVVWPCCLCWIISIGKWRFIRAIYGKPKFPKGI